LIDSKNKKIYRYTLFIRYTVTQIQKDIEKIRFSGGNGKKLNRYRSGKGKDGKMKAKDYLLQVSVLNVKIDQKQMQYEELLQTATSTGAIRYDKERVQTSLSGDSTSSIVCKYIDLQKEINADIDHYVDVKNRIINEIHALSDIKFIKLLYMRYIEEKRLEQIAVELNYSYQYVRELHGYALNAFTDAHPEIFEK